MTIIRNRTNIGYLRARGASAFTLTLLTGCGAGPEPREPIDNNSGTLLISPNVDPRRSLAITDQPILERFSFKRVLDQVIGSSGVSGQTALALFRQWWDTQNPAPGLGLGPHCDDTADESGATLNGYPYTCRPSPAEGNEASCDPFSGPNSPCAYIPIGLFMRFDLAPAGGGHCGEYRIVYARRSGAAGSDRNLIIFEAALGNPHPDQGINGCEDFVRAWADLSDNSQVVVGAGVGIGPVSATAAITIDLNNRADKLEQFYFSGYHEFNPVITASNFGDNSGGFGQVRTNQFIQPVAPKAWSLREFKIKKQCVGGNCELRFVPVTNKVNPFGPLFDPASAASNASAFKEDFLGRVGPLASSTLTGIQLNTPDVFNSGQSQASGSTETNYVVNFGVAPSTFREQIHGGLLAIGSNLTPDDVVKRAQAMACAGCHRLSNNVAIGGGLTWPASLGFTHVSEKDADVETIDGVARYLISPALVNVLLPRRKQIVEDYLNHQPLLGLAPNTPIGGRWTD